MKGVLKILMVNRNHSRKGGDSAYAFELTKLLETHGHSVIPFAMRDEKRDMKSPYSDFFVENIDFVEALKISNFKMCIKVITRTFYSRQSRKQIGNLIGETKPNIAHLHTIHHHISPSILYELKKYQIPIVWTIHDYALICPVTLFLSNGKICESCLGKRFFMAIVKKCKYGSLAASVVASIETYVHHAMKILKMVDVLIAPSLFMKNKLIQHGVEENKITHIPHCIDTDLFVPHFKSGDYIVFLGRLSKEKGVDTLLRAMKRISTLKLLVIGNGPSEKELKEEAHANNLANIIFTGYKQRHDIITLVRNAAFVVFPSECYENLPMSIMEAFALGKPVIASRIGAMSEMVDDGVNGILFEMGDPNDLAEKIIFLWDHPRLRSEMGLRARELVEKRFSLADHYEAIMGVYSKLLGFCNTSTTRRT